MNVLAFLDYGSAQDRVFRLVKPRSLCLYVQHVATIFDVFRSNGVYFIG